MTAPEMRAPKFTARRFDKARAPVRQPVPWDRAYNGLTK